ncbi:MAG: S8 family serine peptidase [Clostridiales bacterium]|nr:S8 family serine peptidase [Clostridiales bacterium]
MRKILIPTAALLAFCFTAAEAETIRTTTAEEYAAAMQEYSPASDTSLFAMGIQSDESSNILLAAYDGSLDGQGALYDIWDEYNIHTLIYKTAEETASAYEYYVSNEIPVCYNEKMTLQASRPTAYMPYLSWGSAYVNTSWLTSQLKLHFGSVANMPEITVVEIDSGIDYTHPELKGRIDTASGYDFYNNDSDPMDDHSHGTHVAGIIADNTLANVKIIPIKVAGALGSFSTTQLIAALKKANELRPDVINMSLGTDSEDTSRTLKSSFNTLFNESYANNTIICAAAGNQSVYKTEPNNADYIFPAYMDNVITVANSTNTGGISSSSNYGTVIELAAPGTSISSTIPVSMGSYKNMSGTSMACPFVTAAVAMMRTYYKDITYEEAIEVLRTNTTAFSSSVNTAKGYGSGILNMKGLIPEITPAPTASPTPSPSPSPTPSPAPSPSPSPTVKPDEYGVEITKQSSGNLFVSVRKEHLMYAAQYDSDGVLLGILQKNSSFLLTPSADASEIKIFIWDEDHSMMPLTTVKSYILSDK